MFQQFKNIFPNATLNISSITNSISIPEASLNRLDAIKNEFSNLNSFLHNQPESERVEPVCVKTINRTSIIQLEATGQAIHKIQQGIETIHENNQDNYRKQKVVDQLLGELQHTGQLHYKACERLKESEKDMSNIRNNITHIQNTASQLLNSLKAIEQQIDKMNTIQEEKEFEAWKQKEEEDLMEEISLKRQQVKEKEINLKQKYEECETTQQKKRLELYEATFNAELEEYKRKRDTEISSLYSHQPVRSLQTSLEQLQLEDDNKDELDDFFGDEKDNKTQHINQNDESSDEERMDILRDEDYDGF